MRIQVYFEHFFGADFSGAIKPYFYEAIVTSPDQIPSGSHSVQHYHTVALKLLQTPAWKIPRQERLPGSGF